MSKLLTAGKPLSGAALSLLLALGTGAINAEQSAPSAEKAQPAAAQQNTESAPAEMAPAQQLRMAQQQIQQLTEKLQKIEQKALEANPELKKEREDFESLLTETMDEAGADTEATKERLMAIQKEVQGGEVSDEKAQTLQQEFQQKREQLVQAQQSAMQEPSVKEARVSLNENLVAAMQEQNPKTESLIAQLTQARQQYNAMLQSMMQQRMQGQGQSPHQPPS